MIIKKIVKLFDTDGSTLEVENLGERLNIKSYGSKGGLLAEIRVSPDELILTLVKLGKL